jgi:hypothetical protein
VAKKAEWSLEYPEIDKDSKKGDDSWQDLTYLHNTAVAGPLWTCGCDRAGVLEVQARFAMLLVPHSASQGN